MRYSKKDHENLGWVDFSASCHPKRGYYTVIVNRRNHLWVNEDYHWTGSQWNTPSNTPVTNVIKYLPESFHDVKGAKL